MQVYIGCTVDVFGTLFSGNTASGSGDDIYRYSVTVTIHSTCPAGYEGSSAAQGGALDTDGTGGGTLFSFTDFPCAPCAAGSAGCVAEVEAALPCEGGEEPADDEEDDLMVDEDGNPYKQPRPDSPQPSDASNRSGCDQPLGYELDGDDDLQQGSDEGSSVHSSPRPRTPQVSEEPGGPETWATNTKVISSELTDFDVYFIRLGNAADFVNSNRAKITYSKVMDGRKRKKAVCYLKP